MIAAADFAGLVCQAISTPAAAGQRFYPKGPEPLTLTEALRTYCAALAPRARVSVAPLPVMSTVDHLMLRGELRRTINTMRLLQRLGDVGDGTSCDSVLARARPHWHGGATIGRSAPARMPAMGPVPSSSPSSTAR
jgi:uncharacterized protein YbjT (DUF2867 family)